MNQKPLSQVLFVAIVLVVIAAFFTYPAFSNGRIPERIYFHANREILGYDVCESGCDNTGNRVSGVYIVGLLSPEWTFVYRSSSVTFVVYPWSIRSIKPIFG